jgi:hypothetical protein
MCNAIARPAAGDFARSVWIIFRLVETPPIIARLAHG